MDNASDLRETHSSTVFFFGDRAYKVKKPVDLGFLDFSTPELREAACGREVELNRRLAADVYLGVAHVTGPDGDVCDHMVVMRRMPSERRLSDLVTTGGFVDGELDEVARKLASLHARSEHSGEINRAGSAAADLARWKANLDELAGLVPTVEVSNAVRVLWHDAERYVSRRHGLFAQRIAAGRMVDGHGDLLADDIFCLSDGPRILDCLEFDDALRWGDGLADAAFLAMDLERLGHPELGRRFLDRYRSHSGDAWPTSLAHHYIAHRALIRAKVAAVRSAQGNVDAAAEMARLLEISQAHAAAGRVRLVLVGGLPGTGKTTVAREVAREIGAVLLRSDEVRKEITSACPTGRGIAEPGEGIYAAPLKARTYEALIGRAVIALHHGESVVLDATWTAAPWRERARAIAGATNADLVELRCDAPADVAAQRIRHRLAAGVDLSDATPEVAAALAAEQDPWDGAVRIDTAGTVDASVRRALAALGSKVGARTGSATER